MGLAQDSTTLNYAAAAASADRVLLFLDPLNAATTWVRNVENVNLRVARADAHDIADTVAAAKQTDRPLLVDNVTELPSVLESLCHKTPTKAWCIRHCRAAAIVTSLSFITAPVAQTCSIHDGQFVTCDV